MWGRVLWLLPAVGALSCQPSVYTCSTDGQCVQDGVQGFCHAPGNCSFPDDECPSGQRYGELANDGLSGTCVPPDLGSTGSSGASNSGTSNGSTSDGGSSGDSASDPSGVTASATTGSTTQDSSNPSTTSGSSSGSMTSESTTSVSTATTSGSDSSSTTTTSPGTTTEQTTGVTAVTETFGERNNADHQQVTRDTFVSETDPTYNFGSHADVHIAEGAQVTALVEFDLSAIPSDATIVEASLELWTEGTGALAAGSVNGYLMLENWAEGQADYAAGFANWTERTDGVAWTTPGAGEGSRDTEVLFTFAPTDLDTAYVVDIPPATVQQWVIDASSNHGLALVPSADATASTAWLLSREYNQQGRRPLMTVTWVP